MFNPKKTVVKPTPLNHPRKLVVNKVIPGEHASSSSAVPSSFVKKTNEARDTISTALASIKNLQAHDDREGVSSSYRQEYTQSIRTFDRIIRRDRNYTVLSEMISYCIATLILKFGHTLQNIECPYLSDSVLFVSLLCAVVLAIAYNYLGQYLELSMQFVSNPRKISKPRVY
jgi:hypothetical protein